MEYHSTRGFACRTDSAGAVLEGLAADGGLYVPEKLPAFDWQDCVKQDALTMAEQILTAFFPDIPGMKTLVKNAYTGKFETTDITPTVTAGDFTVLELFRGPTAAFKDVALSMLPQLLCAAKHRKGNKEPIWILTATSGDTGKAALEGFRDVPGVGICVFYPYGGVSPVQQAQMETQQGSNVAVCAIRGNFDDAQSGVKEIFTHPLPLSSANSINIGRLVPQLLYYFRAYQDLLRRGRIKLGEEVNFSVPTGNFGDILAGYLAKRLGLPVGMLICASNANRVLTDFLQTGVYDRRRPLLKTTSPSMDILVSSNLERLLYFLTLDPERVAAWMAELKTKGVYTLPGDLLKRLQEEFYGTCCDDRETADCIGRVYQKTHYLCDPHTAAAWQGAERYIAERGDKRPMVVLSTASPFKFPAAVLSAIGEDASGDAFAQMERLSNRTGLSIPKSLSGLRQLPRLHTGVIEKEEMLGFVEKLSRTKL